MRLLREIEVHLAGGSPGFPGVVVSLDKIGCRGDSIVLTQEELREHGPGGQPPSWLAIFAPYCKGALWAALAALAVYGCILLIGWAVKSGPVGRSILRLIAVVLAAWGPGFLHTPTSSMTRVGQRLTSSPSS